MSSSLLLVAVTVFSQVAQPAPDLAGEAARLIKQLDDPARAVREDAERRLTELGPEVLAYFPPITPRTPAETKERLNRVRQVLETRASEAIAQPSRVTLKGEMTLVEALRSLESQTGNRVVGADRRPSSNKLKLDFENKTYWEVLDEVLDQADLTINPYGGETNALVLAARPMGETPRAGNGCYSGVFRIEALRVEARRDLRLTDANGMRITLGITWEPRITPITIRQPVDRLQLVDAKGQPLMISQSDRQPVLNASGEVGMSAIELPIPLDLPDRSVAQISSLKGTFTALVPGRLEAFEFSDLEQARDSEQQRAGVTVTFERLRKNGDLWEARLRVRYSEAANALESHRGWIYANPAYVVDAKGQRIENLGTNESSRDENEFGIACIFDLPQGPKGCKFVYQTPTSLIQLPVEYELKNILLP